MTKKCSRCHKEKSLTEFSPQKKGSFGRHNQCRECSRKSNREYYRRNPEKIKTKRDERFDKIVRFEPIGDMDKDKFSEFMKNYPLCEICGEKCGTRSRLSIDHDHKTNEVRGFVCLRCNMLLGYARDDARILLKAVEYLKRAANPLFTATLTSKLKALKV